MLRFRSAAALLGLLVLAGCPSQTKTNIEKPGSPHDGGPDAPLTVMGTDGGPESPPLPSAMDYSSGPRRTRRDPADMCEPVKENMDRSAKAIVAGTGKNGPISGAPWDRKTTPKYSQLVTARYALTTNERAMLAKNGFVVPARLTTRGYADALHDLYQSQLPIYVSADAILHTIFKSNDAILEETERDTLAPRLTTMLGKMHDTLDANQSKYPPDIAHDADVYLAVARSLFSETNAPSHTHADAEVKSLVESAQKGTGGLVEVKLFGRPRIIDFSQYTPRGHYAKTEELQRYFRATMWLSRLEMNLVSRGSRSSQPGIVANPEETPREAVLALAIADLAERAGVLGDLDVLDGAWTEFAGKREDVSIRSLLTLKKTAGIGALTVPDSAEQLKKAIGTSFQRTTRVHYMPQNSWPLPAISTMLGPRIVPDSTAETELVHSHVPNRYLPSFADVTFMMGHERAKTWLATDLARFPELGPNLEKGRTVIAASSATDLYNGWLASIRALGAPIPSSAPSFMKTDAFKDMRVNSTVAAYGQLRHNYVLIAGQAYDEGGCEVPDGFVEPAVQVWEGLIAYAQRGAKAMKAIGASAENLAYFQRLESTIGVLLAISKDELEGRPLSVEEKRWLSMIAEIVPPSSDGPGSYDGWYFDLFPTINEAFSDHAFIADWFTSSNANSIVYAGATVPRLGIFVVDTGGEPRMMVGPVARAYEHVGKLDGRLKDSDAGKIKDLREPWAASYTAPAPAALPLQILSLYGGEEKERLFAVRSTGNLGNVTLELLGHHREKIASATRAVGAGWVRFTLKQTSEDYGSILRARVGEYSHETSNNFGNVNDTSGPMKELDWEKAAEIQRKLEPPAK